jgi:hypothetical protein
MKLKLFILGMTPFLAIYGYFLIKLTYSSLRLFGLAGLSLIGICLISLAAIGLVFFFYNVTIVKLILGVLKELWMIVIILTASLQVFQYFHILLATAIFNGVFGVYLIIDAFNDWKFGERQRKISFKDKRTKILAISISAVFVLGAISFVSPFYNNKTYTFEVSDAQAQNYELVLYYPNTIGGVNACRDANATLSFNMPQSWFNVSNPNGIDMANLVSYANAEGVLIEIWPLFDSGGYHYISARNTEHLWELYADFHNWTDYYNITVDYILWDIEDFVQGEDLNYEGWAQNIPVLNSLGNLSMYGVTLMDNLHNWNYIIEEWKLMAVQALNDGHIMRGTVNPRSWDYADGDFDLSIAYYMPSYELLPEFQYISSMIYTGCEWGMAAGGAGSEYVYQSLTQMKRVNNGPLAVDLGCINYIQYQNITAVKNDVMLAVSQGADAIRLFQGGSWVNGWIGPAHGYSGLNDLLQACRTGGTGSYRHTGVFDMMFVGGTIADIIVDFFKW